MCLYDGENEKEEIGTPILHCSVTLNSLDFRSTSRMVPSCNIKNKKLLLKLSGSLATAPMSSS